MNKGTIKGNEKKEKTMSANHDSHQQLQQMAHRAGLHLSEADLAFVTSFRPYRANQLARSALLSSSKVQVTNIEEQIVFLPRDGASVGLIFYPGARVEAEAYAAFLHEIARWGYATFVPKMPLGLAVFGEDRAATLISAYPAIHRWDSLLFWGLRTPGGRWAGGHLV